MKAGVESLRALAKKALAASAAQETEVWVSAEKQSWVRFAQDTVSTSGSVERTRVSVSASFGKRAGSATTEDVSPDGIARVVRTASDFAKLLPASPERMPAVPPQRYAAIAAWDAGAAGASATDRASRAGSVLAVAKGAGLVGAGYHEVTETVRVFASSTGASGTHRATEATLECTLRSTDGKQSGWAAGYGPRLGAIDAGAIARRAADKATRWKDPIALEPGRYTAILEPAALEPLLGYLSGSLDRRAADEGRSAFSAPGGKTRIGEALFSERVRLASDPADKAFPGSPFAEDGLAAKRFVAIEKGTLVGLPISRYWAKEKKLSPSAAGSNWVLSVDGADPNDIEGLIASTERGILVTRLWYVRMLSPQNLTVTGLTRDATFLVENGQVTSPIRNFRVNQSLLDLLKNVEGAGAPQPFPGASAWLGIPALKVKDMTFSSSSDAV